MGVLLLILGGFLLVGLLAYIWMRLQFETEPGWEGFRWGDDGEALVDGFAIIGDLYPLIEVRDVACWRDGEHSTDPEANTGYVTRGLVIEWLGTGYSIGFGEVRPR